MNLKKPRTAKVAVTVAFLFAIISYNLSQHTARADALVQDAAKNPLEPTETNIALGLDHFNAHCASCHGQTGKADTKKGKQLAAADLTSQEIQSKSDEELFSIISKGVPGTAMPGFAKTHNPTEISQTILLIRKLPTLTPDERKKLEAAIPPSARHKHGIEHEHHQEEDRQRHDDHQQPQAKEHQHEHSTSQVESSKAAQPDHQHKHDAGAMQKEQPEKPPAQPQQMQEHRHDAQSQPNKADQQDASKPQHQHGEQPADAKTDAPKTGGEHAGHDMSGHNMPGENGGHDMHAMMSTITGGPFKSMAAIGSGTSLMPASSPGYMWHWMKRDWMIMAHGDLKIGFNHQGGPRGVNKAESQNWFMLMAERQVGRGRLMLRGMFSAEPWTTPNGGFPQLFQTGETFKGRPIVDAQHAHDLFMELAAAYTHPLSENVSIHLYGGPVGEPALGPVAFMHRLSASENPVAPLGHHWMDSTHIAHGVFTAGITAGRFRFESSIFRGAEPDENRKTIDFGKLDSYSARVWFTPTPNWTAQVSYGYLTNPEAAAPGDLKRWTASIHHNRNWRDGFWASSLIWGRNSEEHGKSNAYLFESTVNFLDKNYFFTRLELGDKTGLLRENVFGRAGLIIEGDDHGHTSGAGHGDEHDARLDQWFRVGGFTFGGVRDFVATEKLRMGLGAGLTFYHVPDGLKPIYGSSPKSFQIFLRFRPGRMNH
jgi:mono/diheme cytochrome c family protein